MCIRDSYETAFESLPGTDVLNALLVRTVYAEADAGTAPQLVDYVVAQRAALAEQPLDRLLAGDVAWRPA